MTDEAVVPPLHARLRRGLRHRHNWFQFVRFGVVGASGYAVNLGVFALLVHPLSVDYRIAAVCAFLAAVLNNFWWNRHWTFGASAGHAGFQAARFFTVSIGAFLVSLGILQLLVGRFDMAEVAAQAIAIVVATPLNFVGNKLWSFQE